MIQTKADYLEYIKEDRKAMIKPRWNSITFRYLKTLRKAEYYTNVQGRLSKNIAKSDKRFW